jgi:hypothetical protein
MKFTFLILPFFCLPVMAADDKPVAPQPVPTEMIIGVYHDYKNCKMLKVEADGITISHSLGVAKILFTDLPPDMRKTYGYDPEAAKKALADEAAKNAASDAAAEKLRLASVQAKTQAESPKPAAPVSQAIQSQIASLQARITSLEEEAASLDGNEKTIFESNTYSNGTGGIEHRYSMGHSRQANDNRAQIIELQLEINTLQKQLASSN